MSTSRSEYSIDFRHNIPHIFLVPNPSKFSEQIDLIGKRHDKIKQDLSQQQIEKNLLSKISQWEKDSIAKIRLAAKNARAELQQIIQESNSQLTISLSKLSNELRSKQGDNNCTENDIEILNVRLEGCKDQWKKLNELNIVKNDFSPLNLIKISKTRAPEKPTPTFSPSVPDSFAKGSQQQIASNIVSQSTSLAPSRPTPSNPMPTDSSSEPYPYPSIVFNIDSSSHKHIRQLFEHLRCLPAMDKSVAMSGDCDVETTQMEKFLSETFDFQNTPREYIVQGVKAFRLRKPPMTMDPDTVIHFPSEVRNSFAMTIKEILDWQSSYAVYADKDVQGMNKQFIHDALQGVSNYGDEAFRMKFIVRISQCPILMEFNARIIPRQIGHEWVHRIKLVSVTGIDFAGRIHDINDITTYIANWQDIYEMDQISGRPKVFNERDFHVKPKHPQAEIHEKLLLKDLMRMARLRLRACDIEGVQIVVETGIGLGVFAGKHIGIDGIVRTLSAQAIRKVLTEDGPNYKNILAVVFALPIFDTDVYQAFVDEFDNDRYKGSIPVLIADQDMHRLTVAIAFEGFVVSELNPADSHGVFGEYWQNRGPAVEEKLALTTVGLLVQHHLINPHVADPIHYHLI